MKSFWRGLFPLVTAVLLSAASPLWAQGAPATLDGIIASVDGRTLTLTVADGTTKVTLGPDALILGRRPATLSDIKPGDALGVAARNEADDSLTATSINIFAPEMYQSKGMRKGQFPMDGANKGLIMTNAMVTQYAESVKGHTLKMQHESLTTTINVPDGTDIHRLVISPLSSLKPGLKVTLRGKKADDGSFAAASVGFVIP